MARKQTRARIAELGFEALSIEGGLLSPDWLGRVAQLSAGSQSGADYGIPKGLNLRDEIGRYWRIAQAHWGDFVAGRTAQGDQEQVAERFVLSLLRESFGFASLAAVEPVRIAERTFPIGHAAFGHSVPVVVASAGSGLDTPMPATGDGRRRSAFGLAQEYLNTEEGAVWGLASDGTTLRILRDNASLTRPAWIEADLQRVFVEARYADFAALWLLAHETRFGRAGQPASECALEAWRSAGREQGTRARLHLRRGVEDAVVALGQGFLAHPDNLDLRARLQSGALSTKDLFSQLLRLVYRIIFLLTVEERGLLHPEAAAPTAKDLYAQGYSLRRLRDRSVRRSAHDRFSDLWEATKVVFRGVATGEPRLGLPALAGLFAADQCPVLDAARVANRALLLAVFKLAWLREDSGLVRVNWRDMGPEELGSVYESLLELLPQITKDGRQFAFAAGDETKGNARKTSGSYYTHESLVQVLLDQALEPVIADTLAKHQDQRAAALLGLSIVDPACGSGHFLLAAARRLAAHVAKLQTNGTPSAGEYRRALRQVIGRCVYGVDLNPMAVELCKVALWMEAVEPGLPLSFLDSHIQRGNALLGATPELLEKGIPDVAFEPIEGDNKVTARALKRRNMEQAGGQTFLDSMWSKPIEGDAQAVTGAVAALEASVDTSFEALVAKESRWEEILGSAAYRHQKFLADMWCAAFVWPKQSGPLVDAAPTMGLWRSICGGQPAPALTVVTVDEIVQQYGYFHWHLQFPLVFGKGGFDVVLGNPPWERVKLQELEFFASRSDEIASAPNAAARKRLIATLPATDPRLWDEWCRASRVSEGQSHFVRHSGRYPLCGKGDVNTYALFAEHNRCQVNPMGSVGCILPAGIATDDTTKDFFQRLVATQTLLAIFHFENEDRLFVTVNNMFRYVLLTLGGTWRTTEAATVVAFARNAEDVKNPARRYALSAAEIQALNPNTGTFPTFRTRRDADVNLAIYRRVGVLWREGDPDGNPWGLRFLRMLDMANDSDLFRTRSELESAGWRREGNQYVMEKRRMLPLLEAKMVHHFDHRFATYDGATQANVNKGTLPQATDAQHADVNYFATPEYWVAESEVESRLEGQGRRGWLLGWRDICRSTDRRTVVASLFPWAAVGHTTPVLLTERDPRLVAALYANLCSLVLDYAARQKVGGTHLTYSYLKQLPVLGPSAYLQPANWTQLPLRDWIGQRVLELTYTAHDLESFARDVGYEGAPFRWDPDRRFQLRCELDAAFFHLYGITHDDAAYILDTFPVVKKSELQEFGEYRTKRVVLDVYEALSAAAQPGQQYRSPLFHRENAS